MAVAPSRWLVRVLGALTLLGGLAAWPGAVEAIRAVQLRPAFRLGVVALLVAASEALSDERAAGRVPWFRSRLGRAVLSVGLSLVVPLASALVAGVALDGALVRAVVTTALMTGVAVFYRRPIVPRV